MRIYGIMIITMIILSSSSDTAMSEPSSPPSLDLEFIPSCASSAQSSSACLCSRNCEHPQTSGPPQRELRPAWCSSLFPTSNSPFVYTRKSPSPFLSRLKTLHLFPLSWLAIRVQGARERLKTQGASARASERASGRYHLCA